MSNDFNNDNRSSIYGAYISSQHGGQFPPYEPDDSWKDALGALCFCVIGGVLNMWFL